MSNRAVWIVQCLCPDRHCILANAGEASDGGKGGAAVATALMATLATMIARGEIQPWCGLCHAPATAWRFESNRTRFRTMEEAEPELRRLEAENAATAALFGDMPRSD